MKTHLDSISTFAAVAVLAMGSIAPLAAAPAATDDFSANELSSNWAAAKGTWSVSDGHLKGVELPSDKHAAVLTYKAPHTDSEASIAFELAGSDGFHLSFNYDKGHLFRVIVTSQDISVRTDKDKKDPSSQSELIGKADAKISQGEKHTLTCKTAGEKVTVCLDGKEVVSGSHPALSAKKTGYRLVLKGEGVLFDDFAIAHME